MCLVSSLFGTQFNPILSSMKLNAYLHKKSPVSEGIVAMASSFLYCIIPFRDSVQIFAVC